MSAYHIPALLAEVLEALEPTPGHIIVDATLGGGGHAEAILQRILPDGILVGLDQDDEALSESGERLHNYANAHVRLRKANFAEMDAVLQASSCPR